jgi:type I restriction enzyme M protein
VVVPHGVLFRGGAEGKIRQKLIEENLLDAVIGLPANLFFGTGIPAAILIFKRQRLDRKVLFIDASREYLPGTNQNYLRTEDLNKILSTFKTRQIVDKYAFLADFEEMKENEFNLNIPRYVDTFEPEPQVDLREINAKIRQLKVNLSKIETTMDYYLQELMLDE